MAPVRINRVRIGLVLIFVISIFLFKRSFNNVPAIKQSSIRSETGEPLREFDFIVVGGGQSGLVLGNRLSEDGKNTVLVVEYGYLYRDDPKIARPWRPFDPKNGIYHDPKLLYNYTSTPQAELKNRSTKVEAGATVGGGSTVNGMFMNRGAAWDYDAWEALGNPGWGWEGMLPYFKKSATFTPPDPKMRKEFNVTYDIDAAYGGNGPIHLSNPAWAWEGQKNQMAGWEELGVPKSSEGASGDAVGVFWVPRAQDPATQERSYSVSGHYDAAANRPNFELMTGQRVKKILLTDDGRAGGISIQTRDSADTAVILARKEIIMCAGLHTPVILQRSGIGPKHVLEAAGIPVLNELPGVGMNFQDHPAGGLGHSYDTDHSFNPANFTVGSDVEAAAEEEYATSRTGPFIGGHNAVVFLPGPNLLPNPSDLISRITSQKIEEYLPSLYSGDETLIAGYAAQRSLLKSAFASSNATLMEIPLAGDAYVLMILQKPLSRGTITIDPSNPIDGDPLIDFHTLHNPIDMEIMLATIRMARKWTETEAMKVLTPNENWPGRSKESDEELRDHLKGMMESGIGHESGTCAMLPLERGGVVAADLTVYGVTGLSVADASLFPLIPSANLCATVYAVAEKAADIIKARHSGKLRMQGR